ncbi:MAG: N-acetylmuramoyl-L-alanine amidase [Erysipelotrichaceae bacterium]|nr:N-acetylmuramoyl-L-alanine amidase [Erysipelotrichaceae bacterium]
MKRNIFSILLSLLLLVSCNDKKITNNNISSSEIIEQNEYSDSYESIIEDESDTYQKAYFKKNISIYINPSVQYDNEYANNLGNEGENMNKISNILVDILKENTNIDVYCNNELPGLSLSSSIKNSNSLNVDYHLALHSNAGKGKGSEGWYDSSSYYFTKSIIDSLDNVLPYKTRGLKNGISTLYELKKCNATSSLIEILFHDEEVQALFITTHYEQIATAIYDGIINYFIKSYGI